MVTILHSLERRKIDPLSFSLFSLSFFLCLSPSCLETSARLRKSLKVNGWDCSFILSCCTSHIKGSIDIEVWIQTLRFDLVGLKSRYWTLYFFRKVINLLRLLSFLAGLFDLAIVIVQWWCAQWRAEQEFVGLACLTMGFNFVFCTKRESHPQLSRKSPHLGWAGIDWSCLLENGLQFLFSVPKGRTTA